MSTCVTHFPPPASAKVKLTLFGRWSGGIGRREVSSAQVPINGEAVAISGAAAGAAVDEIAAMDVASSTLGIRFIALHPHSHPDAEFASVIDFENPATNVLVCHLGKIPQATLQFHAALTPLPATSTHPPGA